MTYEIKVLETLSRVVEIDAENEEDALDKIREMYSNEEIVLGADDFDYDTTFTTLNNEKIKNKIIKEKFMGLDQYIYTANFKDVETFKDFPDRFWIKDEKDVENIKELPNNIYVNHNDKRPRLSNIGYLRKNNLLQGYFERKHNIEDCEYIRITKEDIKYLLNICDEFLNQFDEEFKKQANKFFESYTDNYDELDEKFTKIVSNNQKCQEIINEKLPITEGFFYGEYDLNLWYYGSIMEIQKLFRNLNQEKENLSDYEGYYYSCWY